MDIFETAQIVVAITISLYWFCVGVMVIRSRTKFRVASGSVPKTKLEKTMWFLWAPTIIAWIALTWSSDNVVLRMLGDTQAGLAFYQILVAGAAIACVSAFVMTTRCWLKMGRDWSMAVEPGKTTKLITDGPFAKVRHPIYSLSLMLMISSLLVVSSLPMLVVAIIHCSLLVMKSWNEERYLTDLHGHDYVQYLEQTNRFVPFPSPSTAQSHKTAA